MTAKSGAVFIQYAPSSWYFYISKTDRTRLAYRTIDATGKDMRYQIEEASPKEPRPFVHPANGQVYCFFITDEGRLKCWHFTDTDGVSMKKVGSIMQRQYTDANGTHTQDIPTGDFDHRSFGVTPVPDGFLVTHWNGKDRIELSYFRIATQPLSDGYWKPVATYPLPFDTTTSSHLYKQSSTVIVDGATGGLRLVVAVLDSATAVRMLEAPLGTDCAPPPQASHWESYVYTASTSIKSLTLFMHTAPDGRAYISFYTSDRPCIVMRTTVVDSHGKPVSPPRRQWRESMQNDMTSAQLSGMLLTTAPTASYAMSGALNTGQCSTADRLSAAKVSVNRKLTVAINNGDSFYGRGSHFGDSTREPLKEIPWTESNGVLLGYIEGAPPMPFQNLSLEFGLLGTSPQRADVGITDVTTKAAQTSVAGSIALAIESDGYVAKGPKVADLGWQAGLGWRFAMQAGASWVDMELSSVTQTTEVSQSATDFRTLTAQEVSEIPGADPSLVGTHWPLDMGTAFIQRTAVTGFVYRFIPNGYSASNIPVDVPVMYEYGPSKLVVQALAYYINPSDVVPGDLQSYKNPRRMSALDQMQRAAFNSDTYGSGNPPYISYSASGGTAATTMAWFSQTDASKTAFVDITALVGVYWDVNLAAASSEGKVLVGTQYTYASTQTQSIQRQLALGSRLQLHGDPRNPKNYHSFTALTYFIDPVDGSAQSKQLCNEFKTNLLWAGMPDYKMQANRKLLDTIDFTGSVSNPWKICFVVPVSDPAVLPLSNAR